LAIEEQNVLTSKLATKEQNARLKLRVGEPKLDEINFQCNLELATMIESNSSGRSNYFRIYIN
jgi:hypothetical protein